MPKRNYLIILFILLISVFASAISISANSPIAQGQQWSTDIDLSGLENGGEAKINLDGSQIFVVGKISDSLFVIESKTSSNVINYNLNGDNLTLVISGLSTGDHELIVDAGANSDSVIVTFFEPVSREEQDALEDKVNDFQNQVSNLQSTIDTLENQLITKNEQISALQNENSSLDQSIKYLESNISLLEQEGKSKDEILTTVKEDLNLLLTEREEARKSPIAGMFMFGSQNSGFIIGILALVALVVVGVFVKKRTTSIYDNGLLNKDDASIAYETEEDSLLIPEEKESILTKITSKFKKAPSEESVPEVKKRRWATESYEPKEEPKKENSKGFELGDLIKKEN